jgi:hypothetical protein
MKAPGTALLLLLAAAGQASADDITRYCGGGVTGGGGGLRLSPDGSVVRLRRPRAGAPVEETRLEASAPYDRINALLDAAGFERMPRGAPSNMTCSIARRQGGVSHVVMWNIGHPPVALQPALREIEAVGR